MKSIAEVKDLTVRFKDKAAVHRLHFELAAGEVLGILGPNGSGKTTTLACLEGLLSPSSGTVRLFGLDPMTGRRRLYARLGVQLQEANYPLRIRVGELCALFASFYDQPANWPRLLDALDLRASVHRSVQSLSGGEKQKLSVVLALMGRPELLILDELSTGLDPETRVALRSFLRDIAGGGVSMILVTHHPDELAGLAGRILLLDGGRAQFLGTPDRFRLWARDISGSREPASTLDQAYLSVVAPAPALPLEELS